MEELLDEAEHECRLHVIIETNAGLESAFEIAIQFPNRSSIFWRR